MTKAMQDKMLLVSGVLGFVIPTYFAWTLYADQVPQNIATWSMVFVLDVLGLVLAYRGGNPKPYLQLGWAFAAFCILVAVVLNKSPFKWGWTESASVVLGCVAIVLWLTMNARVAQWAYMAAMYISFVPLGVDYWKEPQPETLWLWLMTIASCLLAILGAERRDFADTFVPWAAIGINVIITILCLL